MKTQKLVLGLLTMGLAVATQAATVTWNFQGLTGDQGTTTKAFDSTPSGFHLTATAIGGNLFVKSDPGDESGLGVSANPDHEITATQWIQLTLPTTPPSGVQFVFGGSVQTGETMTVLHGVTAGSLAGATPIQTLTSDGFVDVSGFTSGFIDIVGGGTGGADVLLTSVSAIVTVPDGGMTVALLGGALTALGFVRRKLTA